MIFSSEVKKIKDPKQELYINSVYQNLSNIAEPYISSDVVESSKTTEIRFVSYEEALKELLDMK